MKKIMTLFAFVLFPFFCLSQPCDIDGRGLDNKIKLMLGFIDYQGERYSEIVSRVFLNRDGSVTICLSNTNPKDNKTLYEIYIRFNSNDNTLPDRAHCLFGEETDKPNTDIFFVRNYTEWNGAYHRLKVSDGALYLQKYSEDEYLLSGELVLDSRNKEVVKFMHYGNLIPDVTEVTGITVVDSKDLENNSGKIFVENLQVETAHGCSRRYMGNKRYYVTDRILMHDRQLEYGIFFDTDLAQLPTGKFSYADRTGILGVGFFDRDTTIIPQEYQITINYNHKKGYFEIGYDLLLIDGRKIRGDYKGSFPEIPLE